MLEKIVDDEIAEAFDPELRRSFDVQDDVKDLVDYDKVRIEKDNILLSGDGTFFTLQGEGPTTGLPCVFVRLHVCNLRCTWCDAYYTWKAESKEFWTESKRASFGDCARQIIKTWEENTSINNPHARRVIWTGGEPLIQKKQIIEVMHKIQEIDPHHLWMAEVETNGTLMPTEEMIKNYYTWQFNCSPKLANSENQHHSMVRPKILQQLNRMNTTFKFVCYDDKDLEEIEEKYLPHIHPTRIVVMPQGITEEEITQNARKLYEPCMQRGWRMMGRLQAVFADGARRGV